MNLKVQGVVKWFSAEKGYGFITLGDETEDIFVHYSSIESSGYKTLEKGTKVEFELTNGAKGKHAVAVSPIA
jgi:cold shock protein